MKIKKIARFYPAALAAFGVFGHGAQADTILDFDSRPNGVANNDIVAASFGDGVKVSSAGITVTNGCGTPNINLTWQGTGGSSWQWYVDSVWAAVQLDNSAISNRHELVFTPNNLAAAVVIKSFNFHPYYLFSAFGERFTYDVSVLDGSTVVSGPTNITFQSDGDKDHPVSINYTGITNQTLTLRITRVASTLGAGEVEGDPYDIAVDDITFAQLPATTLSAGPQVLSVTPANGQTSVAPDYFYLATIMNGDTAVNTNSSSLKLNLNGTSVSPTITQNGSLITVSYQAAGLLPGGSSNAYTLTFKDDGHPATSYANAVNFVAALYVNKQLPAPIVFENFNSTAEGSLPAGWTRTSLDTMRDPTSEPGINYTNLDSGAYTNWTVVETLRFTSLFETYSSEYNGGTTPPGEASDYQRVLSLNPSNVVNGAFVRNLASGRFAFGDSGYRLDALGQVVYMFSPDFNLTGRSNVYLSFHSLWEQNQDSIAAVEYSIDMGTNWQPLLYMLDGPDVITNLDGSIDALTTFTNVYNDVAQYVDPGSGLTVGGYYGAFIGVDSNRWSGLGPYISRRVDDDPVESKRVEILSMPLADNKPNVRLRFAHAGANSWYWGVDDVGLYSLPSLKINSIARSGSNVIISWIGELNTKLQKTPSLTSANWQDVSSTTGASSVTNSIVGAAAFYRLARPY